MKKLITISGVVLSAMLSPVANAEPFGFDRPGNGMGTDVVPKGHLAWEQSLPTLSYDSEVDATGVNTRQLTITGDALLRLGVGHDTEVRVGWDGPTWQRNRIGGQKQTYKGNGDISLGIKKKMQTDDEQLSWALLAQAKISTASKELKQNGIALESSKENIYSLVSAINYQYSDNIATSITMQYDYQNHDLAWSVIPGIQYKITDKVSGFAEYKYRKQESQHKESIVSNGLIWSVRDNLQIDTSIGYSFNKQNPRYTFGLGVAYLF